MIQLETATFNHIVELLLPAIGNESDRQALITPAFSSYSTLYSRIDWSGDPKAFAVRLVKLFLDYGKIEPGKQALVALLEALISAVGLEQQASIDDVLAMLGKTVALPDVQPYRGLEHFEPEHARFYFGREEMVKKLVDKVAKTDVVIVVGPSGCGKSSLVRAGLIATLRAGAVPGSQNWAIHVFHPGRDPLLALSALLATLLEPEASEVGHLDKACKLAELLRKGTLSVDAVINRLRQMDSDLNRLLLVVDQFEELYTECSDKATHRAFVKALLEAAEVEWVTIVLTLRADFYGHVLDDPSLGKWLNIGLFNVLPMDTAERQAAIEEPARVVDRTFETGLVGRILDSLGDEPSNLPLLEFALTELWARQTTEGLLTHQAYEAIGGVKGALARYGDKVFDSLSQREQEDARWVLVQMVRPGEDMEDTRCLASRSELGEAGWKLVQKLADARLVVTDRDPSGQEVAQIAHETLVQAWTQLRTWMDADRPFRTWQERLRAALYQWEASSRDIHALLSGVLLAEALDWLATRGDDLTENERGFIETSSARAQRARRLRLGVFATLVVLVLFAVGAAMTEQVGVFAPRWISTKGPYGGASNSIAVHPQRPNTIYVGTIGRGIFRSDDSGQTWHVRSVGLTGLEIGTIKIDPFNYDVVYCSTTSGAFRSRDRGENWTDISDGLAISHTTDIALDPSQPDLVYVGTWGAGVYRSEDAGEHWISTNSGLTNWAVHDISIDPLSPNQMYVATLQGVFGSEDAGRTWRYLGPKRADVKTVAVDPTNTDVLYAGVWDQGVFLSEDRGRTWVLASAGLTDKRIRSKFTIVAGTGEIYVGTWGGKIFCSHDGSRHWNLVTDGLGIARAIANDPRDPRVLFLATNNGLFKSTDGGQTWSATGLYSPAVHGLTSAGREFTTMFAGTEHGVFRLAENEQWLPVNYGLRAVNVQSLFASEVSAEIAYVVVGDGDLYKRDDETHTWAPFGPAVPSVSTMAIDPTDPDRVLVASSTGQLYLTSDGEDTWNETWNAPSLPCCIVFDGQDLPTIYIGTAHHGVFKGANCGADWTPINTGLGDPTVTALAVDPTSPNIIYAATGSGVWKTTDGGATWRTFSSDVVGKEVYSIVLDVEGQTVWVATERGIFRSDNKGGYWSLLDRGLSAGPPYLLSIRQGESPGLYVGTQEGVYRLIRWWNTPLDQE